MLAVGEQATESMRDDEANQRREISFSCCRGGQLSETEVKRHGIDLKISLVPVCVEKMGSREVESARGRTASTSRRTKSGTQDGKGTNEPGSFFSCTDEEN